MPTRSSRLYETPLSVLGGNYAVATVIPYVWLSSGRQGDGLTAHRQGERFTGRGFGDITLYLINHGLD